MTDIQEVAAEEAPQQDAPALTFCVVIPTRNRSALLCKTLEGLCGQTARKSLLEVVVVSDGSTDSTAETVRHYQSMLPIKYLSQPPRGVSSARNLGLKHTTAPLVLLLDDDVIPSPGLIEEHIRFHQDKPELEAVLLGYVAWHPELKVTHYMRWYGEYGALFGYSLLSDNERAPRRFLYTCNVSFKTSFLVSNGGLNESLSVLEDHELGYRLCQSGMRLFFRRAAMGYHYQTFTFKQSCERIERYSTGLNAFLTTPAGRDLAEKRQRLVFRTAERGVRILAPLLSPLIPLIERDVRLPNFLYRLFYWHYGAYLSFWSKADRNRMLGSRTGFRRK